MSGRDADADADRSSHNNHAAAAGAAAAAAADEDEEVNQPPPAMHPCVEGLCYFLFGMSGWWVYNTLSAEQPIFTACNTSVVLSNASGILHNDTITNCTLPEGRTLSSQISVTSQLGNLVPLLYRVVVKYLCVASEDEEDDDEGEGEGEGTNNKKNKKKKLRRRCRCARSLRVPLVILFSMFTGLLAALLASFKWDTASYIFGDYHSVVLLLCCFMSGGLGCMSSIVYWQFASMYSSGTAATKALSIGMAAGGLFPCVLALLQNLDQMAPGLQDVYFSPGTMLWISSAIQLLFMGLFVIIWRLNANRAARVARQVADSKASQAAKATTEGTAVDGTPPLDDPTRRRGSSEERGGWVEPHTPTTTTTTTTVARQSERSRSEALDRPPWAAGGGGDASRHSSVDDGIGGQGDSSDLSLIHI